MTTLNRAVLFSRSHFLQGYSSRPDVLQALFLRRTGLRASALCLLLSSLLCLAPSSYAVELPSIGGTSAGLISPSAEYALGRKALRQYRAYLPQAQDPYFEDYLDKTLDKMILHSGLPSYPLSVLVIKDPHLNAFAAPGGIVGMNTGTFLIAQTGQQLASILAHEIAHLSQRHYARRLAHQRSRAPLNVASLIGSILILASGNGDAGIAAVTAAQAQAVNASLAFSRDMEREADRVGLELMVTSGFNPHAMPEMFEQLLKASRYRTNLPEFLLTHPVTESRISDAKSRSQYYPLKHYDFDENFQILKARAILMHESTAQFAVKRFSNELRGITLSRLAARYGLLQALIQANRTDDALEQYKILEKSHGHLLPVRLAKADIYAAKERFDLALETIQRELAITPDNHVVNVRYAEVLMQATRYELGESVLKAHAKRQPENAYVWYLLAEMHGLAGHIFEVHKARTEYFILLGNYEKAEIQIRNALRLLKKENNDTSNKQEKARLEQRLAYVKKVKKERL